MAPPEYRGTLTAWFNAWVSQSSEQVWAGLARSIADAAKPVLYPAGRRRKLRLTGWRAMVRGSTGSP